MAHIIVVQPGRTDVVAAGPQFGVPYVLTGPDGTRAVFNDPSDADYVGWLTDVTGLDSPEVREFAEDLVEDDGGLHGSFYYGRRPVVINGQIDNRPGGPLVGLTENVVRNTRTTRLMRATNAMRKDMTMRWQPDGGIEQQLLLRRQQPLRIAGAFNKTFQAGMVAADPRIYSASLHEVAFAPSTLTTVPNVGTADSPPVVTLFGPFTNPTLTNFSYGASLELTTAVTAGNFVVLDFANKTAMLNGVTNIYSAVNFLTTTWWTLVPSDNSIQWTATGTDASSSMRVTYRDAWI